MRVRLCESVRAYSQISSARHVWEGEGFGVEGLVRCEANMAQPRQSRPENGLGFEVNLFSCSLFNRR